MSTLKETVKPDQTLDVRGMGCPMPLLKAKKAVETISGGQVLEVLGTDPGSKSDFESGSKTGNEYLGYTEESGQFKHYLRKKK
jgi:tRNA 2-thiouridine synthesizing protein A